MGKKGGAETQVTQYYLSMQFGICAGPIDNMSAIYVGEKEVWTGNQTGENTFTISQENIFGGEQKEGGVSGAVSFMPGNVTQTVPSWIASKFGLSVADMPAYRGIANFFMTGGSGSGRGFYWSANTPYLKGTWARVSRTSLGLEDQYARIYRGQYVDGRAILFALDLSGSMGPPQSNRITTAKAAITEVLQGVKSFLQAGGTRVDVGFVGWSNTTEYLEKLNASPSDIDAMITWVNALVADGSATNFNLAAIAAMSFFTATLSVPAIQKRVMLFITDGAATPGTDDTAAATMADLLNQTSGSFSVGAGTEVDCYGFNIDLAGGTTYKLDNTPSDGVPVVSGTNTAAFVNAVNSALFPTMAGAFDSNPAHIIYESLINTTWGMGADPSAIDLASFTAASHTLFWEGFGLSIIWTRQTDIEAFVTEVLNHIEGALFVNPRTGLLTLKLIRNDYDPDILRWITPDNANITNFKRKLWGETINELVVSWTDPETEENTSLTVQDTGNIAMQGGIVSDSRNYYGVRTIELASFVANRDLRVASAPLASCDVETDRANWDLLPGDVVKVASPEDNVESIVMRVGPVDYGKPGAASIKVSLVEDIFALATAQYTIPGPTSWIDPSENPSPALAQFGYTMSYFTTARYLGGGDVADQLLVYPAVYIGVLAAQSGTDTASHELYGEITDAAGNTIIGSLGEKTIIPRATIETALAQEVSSTIPYTLSRTQGHDPRSGNLILIGDGDETEIELALVTAVDATNISIERGVLDTIPKAWPIGTPVWFLDPDQVYMDGQARSVAEVVDYYVLPRTSKGVLDISDATLLQVTAMDRPYLPSRPANVKANGTAFGVVHSEATDPVALTWSRRSRLDEESIILAWDAADVAPEAGQTTTITLTDAAGAVINTIIGVTGASYDLTHAEFLGAGAAWVKVEAVRDGYTSLQGHELFIIIESGYGYAYGYNYGESA